MNRIWAESIVGEPPRNAPPRDTSPLVNPVENKIAAAFSSGKPSDILDTVQCKHCKKPILRHAAPSHIKRCLDKKAAKSQRKKEAKEAKDAAARRAQGIVSDEEIVKADSGKPGAKKSAIKELDGADSKKGKKRKAEETAAEKAPKKKKKDEPKAKTRKEKAPVDVETQCGVILPNGAKCARSLTCKSHSMGAKRAVPGRSAKYDVLLAAYQRKNQARQQRAFMDANAPVEEDEEQGTIDSDEEKDAIMGALARARPRALTTHTLIDKKQQYQYLRMKEMLRTALEGHRARGIFDVVPRDDAPRTAMFFGPESATGFGFPGAEGMHDASSRRSSVAPSVRHGQIVSRKGSIAGVQA